MSKVFGYAVMFVAVSLIACAPGGGSDSESNWFGNQQKQDAPVVKTWVDQNKSVIELRKKGVAIENVVKAARDEVLRILITYSGIKVTPNTESQLLRSIGDDAYSSVIFARVTNPNGYFFADAKDLICSTRKADAKKNDKVVQIKDNVDCSDFSGGSPLDKVSNVRAGVARYEVRSDKFFEGLQSGYVFLTGLDKYTGVNNVDLDIGVSIPLSASFFAPGTAKEVSSFYCISKVMNMTGKWSLGNVKCTQSSK